MALSMFRSRSVLYVRRTVVQTLSCRTTAFDSAEDAPKKKVHPHPETPKFPDEYYELPKGKIYDKKPFRLELEAGKQYAWCVCGHSKSQPFCDGSHKQLWGTSEKKNTPKWLPLRFKVEETKQYWLCNCKQTGKRPFCDGSHKQSNVQSAIK